MGEILPSNNEKMMSFCKYDTHICKYDTLHKRKNTIFATGLAANNGYHPHANHSPKLKNNNMESSTSQRPMTFSEFLKSYFGRCVETLKNPKQLIPTLALGVVWLILSVAASYIKLWLPFQALSFLTFAQGGMYGGILGAVGGIIGKVIVAAFLNVLLVPLFTGQKPFKSVGDGLKGLASNIKLNSMKNSGPLLLSFGLSFILYSLLNISQTGENAIVGVVTATLLLKNIGSKGGFAWDFLLSAAGAMSGKQVPNIETINRLLTGAAIGFTLSTVLSLIGLHLCVWIGLLFTIIGTVFIVSGRKKNT